MAAWSFYNIQKLKQAKVSLVEMEEQKDFFDDSFALFMQS